MFWQLLVAIAGWHGLTQLPAELLAHPASFVALAAIAVAGLVAAASWRAHAGRDIGSTTAMFGRTAALREQTRHTAFLRQRDPGAAGRPRPRAPSMSLPAA